VKIKLSLYLINHHIMKTREEWRYSSTILDLCARWRWVVSFMPRPLHRRLDGPQNRSWRCGVKKNLFPLPEIEPRPSSPVARRYIDKAAEGIFNVETISNLFIRTLYQLLWLSFVQWNAKRRRKW
jgi:hypothetical protein